MTRHYLSYNSLLAPHPSRPQKPSLAYKPATIITPKPVTKLHPFFDSRTYPICLLFNKFAENQRQQHSHTPCEYRAILHSSKQQKQPLMDPYHFSFNVTLHTIIGHYTSTIIEVKRLSTHLVVPIYIKI